MAHACFPPLLVSQRAGGCAHGSRSQARRAVFSRAGLAAACLILAGAGTHCGSEATDTAGGLGGAGAGAGAGGSGGALATGGTVPTGGAGGACSTCSPVCGDGACNGDETCATCPDDCSVCPPSCVFPPTTSAIVVYYGDMKDDDGTHRPDLTYQLYNPGLDSVFIGGGATIWTAGEPSAPGDPGSGAFKDYHDHCLRLSYHMGTGEIASCLRRRDDLLHDDGSAISNPCAAYTVSGGTGADDLAAFWKAKLDLGWDYVGIDEIKSINVATTGGGTVAIDFTNGGTEATRFASALNKLVTLGYDKRIFVFFVPHAAGGPPANLSTYADLLTACRDHCRTIQLELYYKTTEIESGMAGNFNTYATALHNLGITNINRSVTAIIAVGNDADDGWFMLDDAQCDISPWNGLTCPELSNSGGIARQLSAMHNGSYAKYWWGVGFYKLGSVRSKSGYWTKTDFVQSLASRLNWWATHSPP